MIPPKRWRSSCNIIQKWHQSSWNKIGQFIWYRSFDMKNLKWTRVNTKRIQVSHRKKQKNIKTDGRCYSEIWSLDTSGRKAPVVSLMCIWRLSIQGGRLFNLSNEERLCAAAVITNQRRIGMLLNPNWHLKYGVSTQIINFNGWFLYC